MTKRPDLSHDPSNPPEWATPEAWDASEKIVDQAEAMYRKLDKKLGLEDNNFGKFIIVSCTDIDKYVIANTELEADKLWQAEHQGDDNAALFQIGNI